MTDKNFKQSLVIACFGLNIFGCALSLMLSILFSLILGEIGAGIGYALGSVIWAGGSLFVIYKISKSYAYRSPIPIQERTAKKNIAAAYGICFTAISIILFICTLFWLNIISGFLCGPITLLAVQYISNKWIVMLISWLIIAAILAASARCAKKGIAAGGNERKEAEAYYKSKEQNIFGTDQRGRITHRNYLD